MSARRLSILILRYEKSLVKHHSGRQYLPVLLANTSLMKNTDPYSERSSPLPSRAMMFSYKPPLRLARVCVSNYQPLWTLAVSPPSVLLYCTTFKFGTDLYKSQSSYLRCLRLWYAAASSPMLVISISLTFSTEQSDCCSPGSLDQSRHH